ncbi:MAG: hypothetical protein VX910_04735 [Candidatus Latescibacterota bacterium]|nr:hypothetical protein [Candidatus Latescibacterota bacterium]
MDRTAAGVSPWQDYLDGKDPDYPIKALRSDFGQLRSKMDMMEADLSTPDSRMSDDMNRINPATIDALTRLMLGGLPTGRDGYPLHCRLRYFDPTRQRAGIPIDVCALVTSMDANSVSVELVNLNQVESRTVVVQGGAYAEHQITDISTDGQTSSVNATHFSVNLAPAAGAAIHVKMQRYSTRPTLAFPWA